jgi:pyridoxal phosphate enzyme (YggS family)
MAEIAAQYRKLMSRIAEAAEKSGRLPSAVKMLAASKSQTSESIRAALAAGLSLIGENYVQEAQEKKKIIAETAEWHMIGHLQRNKVKTAVELFDMIETVDSLALARALDQEGKKRGKVVRTLIEINQAGENSKSGIAPQELAPLLAGVANLQHIVVEGLMTVPPMQDDPEGARRYFRALRQLGESFRDFAAGNIRMKELSMGMSDDFVVAIEEGATIVRIGTALFGPRQKQ